MTEVVDETGSGDDPLWLAIAGWSGVHGLASLWNEGPLRHKLGPDLTPVVKKVSAFLSRMVSHPPTRRR
jgi:hypothetical protein